MDFSALIYDTRLEKYTVLKAFSLRIAEKCRGGTLMKKHSIYQ
jgi:hypothetical protein